MRNYFSKTVLVNVIYKVLFPVRNYNCEKINLNNICKYFTERNITENFRSVIFLFRNRKNI